MNTLNQTDKGMYLSMVEQLRTRYPFSPNICKLLSIPDFNDVGRREVTPTRHQFRVLLNQYLKENATQRFN